MLLHHLDDGFEVHQASFLDLLYLADRTLVDSLNGELYFLLELVDAQLLHSKLVVSVYGQMRADVVGRAIVEVRDGRNLAKRLHVVQDERLRALELQFEHLDHQIYSVGVVRPAEH